MQSKPSKFPPWSAESVQQVSTRISGHLLRRSKRLGTCRPGASWRLASLGGLKRNVPVCQPFSVQNCSNCKNKLAFASFIRSSKYAEILLKPGQSRVGNRRWSDRPVSYDEDILFDRSIFAPPHSSPFTPSMPQLTTRVDSPSAA